MAFKKKILDLSLMFSKDDFGLNMIFGSQQLGSYILM